MTEQVDILQPPQFHKSGVVKNRNQAWLDGDWIGTFNLWILQDNPKPAIVYQVRSSNSSWAANKLDVTAGGHYVAGESAEDGLREVKEELGKVYQFSDLYSLGRKLHVSPDHKNRLRKNVVDIFFIRDNSPLSTYQLEELEVASICVCPIDNLVKVHTQEGYSFETETIDSRGERKTILITKKSFPYNWDNYHFKIALLAKRYLAGEGLLLY